MKPKNPDRLIRINILVTEYQKEHLEKLGKQQASVYIRKLIDAQMSGHEVEISKLKEELRDHEAHANIIKAQLGELEAADQRQQAANQGREELIEKIAQRLKKELRYNYKGCLEASADLQKYIKNNVFGANQKLSGSGEQIQEKEVLDRIFQIRETEEAII